MAKSVLTVMLAVLLNVLVGCHSIDSGDSQLLPPPVKEVSVVSPAGSEADIIEQMAINRQAYRYGLESLIAYYNDTGNNMKLGWAQNELKKLDKMPQYNYILEADVASPDLKATTTIIEADYMYDDALRTEKKARRLLVLKNENRLRMALYKYNKLIKRHPSSDKIDDAAFRAGGIYEHFKDYSIAVIYYQRAIQWDPATPHLAEFRAAYVLDTHLQRRAEALDLYRKALKKGGLTPERKEFIEQRIEILTQSDKSVK